MGPFGLVRDFVIAQKWRYLMGIAALLVVNGLQLVIPHVLRLFTDSLSRGEVQVGDIWRYAGAIILLAAGVSVGRFFWRIYVMGTARLLEYSLRNRLYSHLQSLSPNYFIKHKTGDLMAHATNDINAVRMAMGPGIVLLIDGLFMSTIILFIMLQTTDVRLTLLALLPLPFLALVSTQFGRMISRRFRRVQEAFSDLTDRVQENLAGMRVVKAFARESAEKDRFAVVNQRSVDMNMHLVKIWGLFFPLVQFLSALSFLVVLGYGGVLVMYGTITLGDFVAFNSYLALLTWPMMAIGWVINILQRGKASLERLQKILQEVPEIRDADPPAPVERLAGRIEMRGLTFRYPGSEEPVLQDINLVLEAGHSLAVVGRTGSGKTTLVNLILRLFNPPRGQVFIDGYDVHAIPLQVLREDIGYVPQDNFLFSNTIAGNIAFAAENGFDQTQVERAAAVAQVHQDIVDFPAGYETTVGERGVTLSGGQKQRVSIARAIFKDPRILILDDCLSAVDTHTEEEILGGMRDIMRERSSIIISHRVSTVQDADEIIVLDAGRIAERGDHASLLAIGGIYHEMYQRQLLEERLERI